MSTFELLIGVNFLLAVIGVAGCIYDDKKIKKMEEKQ